ncbi:MAG: hypothetical protein NT029_12130 [Armatimonadetes bacterium]|nr:hypothetical protein [Armatimonadota bacterium]
MVRLPAPAHLAARRKLCRLPREAVEQPLIAALAAAGHWATITRLLTTAADVGGASLQEAVVVMTAGRGSRCSMAIRALAAFEEPDPWAPLLALLHARRRLRAARMAAEALAAKYGAAAITEVVSAARMADGRLDDAMVRPLTKLGGPAAMVDRIVANTRMDDAARVAALVAMASLHRRYARFDVQRHLDRRAPSSREAAQTAEAFRRYATLGRAVAAPIGDLLVRPAMQSPTTQPDRLLRAADAPEETEVAEEGGLRGLFSRLGRLLRGG